MGIALAICAPARADTPASSVQTQPVAQGGTYPGVDAHSEGWFDVGGFCKVVDVGDLSAINPTAKGVPVFIPGPIKQWENYRTSAPAHYNGQLTLTTCCRPSPNITTLCATATNPQSVSLEYGKLGETDTLAATCVDQWGISYPESVAITCTGATGTLAVDNGPDGQAAWQAGAPADICAPNAYTTACDATCPGGTGTTSTFDSCGNLTGSSACTITCCVPDGTCTGNCGGGTGVDSCGNSCTNNATCVPGECPSQTVTWFGHQTNYFDQYQYNNCSATVDASAPAQSCDRNGNCTPLQLQSVPVYNDAGTRIIGYDYYNDRDQTDVTQNATIANNGISGSQGFACINGTWYPQQNALLNDTGTCVQAWCGQGSFYWTDPKTGVQCSGSTGYLGYPVFAGGTDDISNSQPGYTGSAIYECIPDAQGGTAQWVFQSGTCANTNCTAGPWSACVGGLQHETDSCGNTYTRGCTPPTTCPAVANASSNGTPPSCTPTCNAGYTLSNGQCVVPTASYCDPGTLFTQCELQTYQCSGGPNDGVTFDDCGDSCGIGPGIQTTPSNIQRSTWLPPICANGQVQPGGCQFGSSLCYTNTPFSGTVLTGAVCNKSDYSFTCPSYPYPNR